MHARFWIAPMFAVALFLTPAGAQPRYELVPMDVERFFGPGAVAGGGQINDAGELAGWVQLERGQPKVPMVWNWQTDSAEIVDETIDVFRIFVNDSRQLAGSTFTGGFRPFFHDPVDGFLPIPDELVVRAVNDAGRVACDRRDPSGENEAAIWTREGGVRGLGWLYPQNQRFSQAHGISDEGEVVGNSVAVDNVNSTAVYWNATGEIFELIGGFDAFDINGRGEMVGRGPDANGRRIATYWADLASEPVLLPCFLPTTQGCYASHINDRGEILGVDNPDEDDAPVVWFDGQVYLVKDLIDGIEEFEFPLGFNLNNRGEIGILLLDGLSGLETPAVLIPKTAGDREVRIDVEPYRCPGCLEIDGRGIVTVAILGEADLDVETIDRGSLRFEGLIVKQDRKGRYRCRTQFVDTDEHLDLVCKFVDDPTLWTGSEPTGTLVGQLDDGSRIEGTDEICIVDTKPPCGGDDDDDDDRFSGDDDDDGGSCGGGDDDDDDGGDDDDDGDDDDGGDDD